MLANFNLEGIIVKSIKYCKLVRDKIPEIIEKSGKKCKYETLTEESYLEMLDVKLREELMEYQVGKNIEELADLLEVMHAIAFARGFSWDQIELARATKSKENGGFRNRILLKEVIEN